jgi:hypothetical protein
VIRFLKNDDRTIWHWSECKIKCCKCIFRFTRRATSSLNFSVCFSFQRHIFFLHFEPTNRSMKVHWSFGGQRLVYKKKFHSIEVDIEMEERIKIGYICACIRLNHRLFWLLLFFFYSTKRMLYTFNVCILLFCRWSIRTRYKHIHT